MKGPDIDLFAKNTLEKYRIEPKESTWQQLSDELYNLENKKKKRSYRMSAGMLFIGLMLGLQTTIDNVTSGNAEIMEKSASVSSESDNNNVEHQSDKQVKQSAVIEKKNSLVADNKVEKSEKTIRHRKGMTSEDLFYSSTPSFYKNEKATKTIPIQEEPIVEAVGEEVTDADLEHLLKRARTNIERERLMVENRKNNAINLLAEIEREDELPARKRFSVDVKQGYAKLKTVLAN